jgi:hypothetical protein
MGEFNDPKRGATEAAATTRLRWQFKVAGEVLVWDWSQGAPDPRSLAPVRMPKARMTAKHLPAMPFSVTTRGSVPVESGLELDLVRDLDRQPSVSWLVGQPLVLHSLGEAGKAWRHTPDLLSVANGQVTVWDVRPPDRQDQRFQDRAWITRDACRHVGWGYEIFTGHNTARRTNLTWLNAYRSPQACPAVIAETLLTGFAQHRWSTVGDVYDHDLWHGRLVSAMWHLLWAGRLQCDLDQPLTASTVLSWAN